MSKSNKRKSTAAKFIVHMASTGWEKAMWGGVGRLSAGQMKVIVSQQIKSNHITSHRIYRKLCNLFDTIGARWGPKKEEAFLLLAGVGLESWSIVDSNTNTNT